MKKNIFQNSSPETETIFKDESVFYPIYFPHKIPAREQQIKDLSFYLDPIIHNKRSLNSLLHGPPGTGKTLVANYVTQQLTEYTKKAKVVYINAIEDNSRASILIKILSLFSDVLPRRGLSPDEILFRLRENLRKQNFIPIVIIDEVDQLSSDDASSILYDLSRTVEENNYFNLILITNNKEFLVRLDPRTQSSLSSLNKINFNRYTPQELKAILEERISYGLIDKAISDDLVGYIVGHAAKSGGDARVAIDLLFKAAKNTEKKGLQKITKEILISSTIVVDKVKITLKKKSLLKQELKVLKKIECGITSGELYSLFPSLPERTLRRYLSNFEKQKLITIKEERIKSGRVRRLYLEFDKSLLD